MRRKVLIPALGLLILLLARCKKNDEDKPGAPSLKLISVSATTVQQYQNEIEVVFEYEDHQGDLGSENPDVLQLSVKDARLANADGYHLPPMTPDNKELHIKGTYRLKLRPLFLLGNGAEETTTLNILLTDRAGNKSNTLQTGVITITP